MFGRPTHHVGHWPTFLVSFFFFPRLNSVVGDWMNIILRHMVWPYSANLECRSEMRCKRLAVHTGRKKSSSGHHRTTLSGHIFATKPCIDNRKKNLLSSNTSFTCPDNMVNFDPLTAEIGSGLYVLKGGRSMLARTCSHGRDIYLFN